jgi:hypothetical protein
MNAAVQHSSNVSTPITGQAALTQTRARVPLRTSLRHSFCSLIVLKANQLSTLIYILNTSVKAAKHHPAHDIKQRSGEIRGLVPALHTPQGIALEAHNAPMNLDK